jgi:hypothetical protein
MAPEMIFLVKRSNCGLQTWHEVVAPAFSRRNSRLFPYGYYRHGYGDLIEEKALLFP